MVHRVDGGQREVVGIRRGGARSRRSEFSRRPAGKGRADEDPCGERHDYEHGDSRGPAPDGRGCRREVLFDRARGDQRHLPRHTLSRRPQRQTQSGGVPRGGEKLRRRDGERIRPHPVRRSAARCRGQASFGDGVPFRLLRHRLFLRIARSCQGPEGEGGELFGVSAIGRGQSCIRRCALVLLARLPDYGSEGRGGECAMRARLHNGCSVHRTRQGDPHHFARDVPETSPGCHCWCRCAAAGFLGAGFAARRARRVPERRRGTDHLRRGRGDRAAGRVAREDERADLLRARARTRVPGGLARPARFARREAR